MLKITVETTVGTEIANYPSDGNLDLQRFMVWLACAVKEARETDEVEMLLHQAGRVPLSVN